MNHLIIWKELSLFMGLNQRAITQHQHPLVQLVFGMDEPFLWKNEKGDWIEKRSLLITANHRHECDATGKKIVLIDIDPESSLGEFIKTTYLSNFVLIDFPIQQIAHLELKNLDQLIDKRDWASIYNKIISVFQYDSALKINTKRDERIERLVLYIDAHIDQPITTKDLMQVANLSESRLLHLFKQEMGLPIRNYILWQKIQRAFKYVLAGNSLTEAAYYAGFSDQAHLTRTFVKTIGLPPSEVIKNSKFIQVSFPE